MGQRLSVLLVEDEPELRMVTAEALVEQSFEVTTAADGREALHLLERLRPHVVITDMMMPVLDGFELLRHYCARRRHAPVIAVSSFSSYLARAMEEGADVVLHKPYTLGALHGAIDQALARQRSMPPAVAQRAPDEAQRLQSIFELRFEVEEPSDALRQFVEHVARTFEVPICLISIVTGTRQYWYASCGLPTWPRCAGRRATSRSACTRW